MLDILSTLLRLGVAGRLEAASRHLASAFCYPVLAGVAGIGVAACLLVAAWLALLPVIGPIWTPLALAAFLSVTVAISVLAQRARPRRTEPVVEELSTADLSALLSGAIRDHKATLLLGAAMAGLLAGGSRR